MSETNTNDNESGGGKALDAAPDSVWRSEMPTKAGLYQLKCDESKQQEFDVSITEQGNELYADSAMIGSKVPVVLIHRDVTNPQWRHLISISQNTKHSGAVR